MGWLICHRTKSNQTESEHKIVGFIDDDFPRSNHGATSATLTSSAKETLTLVDRQQTKT